MNNELILKAYDIDYSFIIKNYLDPKLWDKEWTLFVYKNFIITLSLKYIYVSVNKIYFEIKITDNNSKSYYRNIIEEVEYSLKTDNINILKKKINKKILYIIEEIEKELYIEETEEYYKIVSMEYEEVNKLTKIAEKFLDDNNIINKNIREAYIDAYVNNTSKICELKHEYIIKNKYKMIPDLYLAFARATNNEELEKEVLNANEDKKEELLKKIEELEKYLQTEEYEEEAKNNLTEV